MPKYIPRICILLLLIGLAPLPIGYYTLLRFVVCGTFAVGALIAYERDHQGIMIIYGLMAVLFNPFILFVYPKVQWIIDDILAAGLLLATSKYVTEEDSATAKKLRAEAALMQGLVEDEPLGKNSINFKESIPPVPNIAASQMKVMLDGSDYEHSIPVSNVAQEYAWIKTHYPKSIVILQNYEDCHERPVDVLQIQTSDGSKKTVYFDITENVNSYSDAVDVPPSKI
jgi:hypothetical protein